jgi:hypothetical protein
MASKNGSKPRSNDEYDAAYFLRGAGDFFAVALRGVVDFADVDFADDGFADEDLVDDFDDEDRADDFVDDDDGRGADRVLRGRVVPCERLPR